MRRTFPLIAAVMVAALSAGCGPPAGGAEASSTRGGTPPSAAPGSPSGRPMPVPADTTRPTGPATAPPKKPTDPRPGDVIAGRVTKGGSGPCYGLVTDDGTEFALHGTAGLTLDEGTYVRAHVAPLRLRIYCGPGQHRALVRVEKVG